MANKTTYFADLLNDAIFGNDATAMTTITNASLNMALLTSVPSSASENMSSETEVIGGVGYAQIAYATWSANMGTSSGGIITSSADISWPQATGNWGSVTGVVWVDVFGGANKIWYFVDLTAGSGAISPISGNIVRYTSGNLTLTET